MEQVGAGVDLTDGLLLRGAVLVLNDGPEGSIRLPEDAAVVASVLQHRGEESAGVAVPEVGLRQRTEGLPLHQRGVAAADQHMAVKALQQVGGALHRVSSAVLLGLNGVGILGIGSQDCFLLPAYHQDHVLRGQKVQPG